MGGGDGIATQDTEQVTQPRRDGSGGYPTEMRRKWWRRNVKLCEMLGDVGEIVYFCGDFYNKAKTKKNYEESYSVGGGCCHDLRL
jgi:hypothetical protein